MKSSSHFAWIDFLRGISALGVVLFHVRVDLWVGWAAIRSAPNAFTSFDRAASWLSIPTPFFGSAVMLFFLVSGFCVHYPHAAGRPLKLGAYACRRFFRIYPPYLAIILLIVLLEWFLKVRFDSPPSSVETALKSVLMVQNYGTQAGQMASNPSLWTLPVEMELYLAYPLFFWILIHHGLKKSLLAAAAVSAIVLLFSLVHPTGAIFQVFHPTGNFALYWIIWCAGAALAELTRQDRLPTWRPWFWMPTGFALIMALAFHARGLPDGVQSLTWATFYLGVLLWGLSQPDPLHRLSDKMRQPLLFLGLISYSLYLIHFPFFRLCGILWVNAFGSKPANFCISLAFCALCIPIAYLFHRMVEAPSHWLAKRVGDVLSPRNVMGAVQPSPGIALKRSPP